MQNLVAIDHELDPTGRTFVPTQEAAGSNGASPLSRISAGSDDPYVRRLESLRPLGDLERDALPLLEAFVAVRLDLREMDEDVVSLLPLNEAEALLVAEPLDRAFGH